jgi:hypothetical protein
MPGYEAFSLFNEMVGNLNTILFGYISILSAFLVMAYFSANRLSTLLMVIVLILFTATCFTFIIQVNLIKFQMASLYVYMIDLKNAGDLSLEWFGNNPPQSVNFLTIFHNIITVGGYLGSVTFFIYQRSQDRN